MMQSTSLPPVLGLGLGLGLGLDFELDPDWRRERWANAGVATSDAAVPVRKLRRDSRFTGGNSWLDFGSHSWVCKSWFAKGFTLRCDEANSCPNQRCDTRSWLTIHCHRRGAMNGIATSVGQIAT
jgi:hypothetical protein